MRQQTSSTKIAPMPLWLVATMALLYLGLLAALVFLPGTSLLDRLRWLDSGICAQLPSHSFYPGGERLPLCARNTGIYLGFTVTLIMLYATGRKRAQQLPPWSMVIALAVGVAMLAVDGFNSFLLDLSLPHLYQPHNLLRLGTGLVTGLAMGIFTHPILNRLFWRQYNQQRNLAPWKALFPFLPALLICFFAVASQSAYVLYPLALLSSAGLLLAMSNVNLIFIIALSKRDETFERYRELLPFFSLAVVLAIGELLALAQLKLALLQTLGV